MKKRRSAHSTMLMNNSSSALCMSMPTIDNQENSLQANAELAQSMVISNMNGMTPWAPNTVCTKCEVCKKAFS